MIIIKRKKTVIINAMFDNVLQWHIFINYEILNKEIGIELNIRIAKLYRFFFFVFIGKMT